MDSGPEAIKDSKGVMVYDVEYGSSSEAISWVWRELLLSAIVHSSTQTLAKTLVADVTRFGVADGILKRLDTELARTCTIYEQLLTPLFLTPQLPTKRSHPEATPPTLRNGNEIGKNKNAATSL